MIRGDSCLILDSGRDDFPDLLAWIREHGRPVTVGAAVQYELRNLATTFLDPTDVIPHDIGIPNNLPLWSANALSLISGISADPIIERITGETPRTASFGDYTIEQLFDVRNILFTDPGSRGSVIHTRFAELQFLFRDEALELHVHTPQNEALRFAESVFCFTQLQLTMANMLGVRTGPYHHHTAAMYLRSADVGRLDHMHPSTVYVRPDDDPRGFGVEARNWEEVADRAAFVLDVATGNITTGFAKDSFSASEKWYLNNLRPFWLPS